MSQIAVPWLVLQQTGSAALTGLVGAAEIAPYVVLQLLGAPLVDRFGGRRVSFLGNLVAACAMGALSFVSADRVGGLLALVALVFLAGLARGPAGAATQVMLPAVAGLARVSVTRAAAVFDGSSRLAAILGAAGGGVLIAAVGSPAVVFIDAVTFAAAAVLLILIPGSAGRTLSLDEDPERTSYRRQIVEGLDFLRMNRLLRSIAGMVFFTNFADSAVSGLLILLWAQRTAFGTAGVGYVTGAVAVGSVLGAFAQAAWGVKRSRRRTFAVSFLLAGAPRLVALVIPLPLWAVVLVWAASGLGAGAINPILSAAEYETVPRRLQARVLSAVSAIAWAGIPFGPIVAAAGITIVGFSTTVGAFAVLYLAVTLSPFLQSRWSLLDVTRGSAELRTPG
jgi:MFS family permease